MFSHLTNLTSLCLSFNHIEQLDGGVFSHLKSLENLNISKNNIRELKPEIFVGLDKLINLDMKFWKEDFHLDVDLFQFTPSIERVSLNERFKEMKHDLSEKYGSKITFYFDLITFF